ncbi:hypothetical protein O1611_g1990 [Lasiodiplodia mahajangana]|uniref:Uncharacterized protein n=1 Tax=Lasiodiplodia mahajangana TaxID=1108764 RepID=A0ACC2JWJ0_9PEZI|nr:hypothetical protein O1611_g1990 [Lasiodiplodia mahajangana]
MDTTSALFEQARRSPPFSASAFLLDFLYPTRAVSLMSRRLSPISPDRSDRLRFRIQPSHVSPRLYNSSSPHQRLGPSPSPAHGQSASAKANDEVRDDSQGYASPSSVEPKNSEPLDPLDTHTHITTVERILEHGNFDNADLLWRHYKSLDEPSQNARFRQVLAFLSRTDRVSDSWKISELFHRLDISDWDYDTFVSGVCAEINLQNLSQALSIFERGLRSTTLDNTVLVDALDLLLAAAFRSPTTTFLQEIWKLYPEMATRWDFDGITADLKHSASVSSIAEKAMLFPDYMAEQLDDPSSTETDREALQVLQKILVRKALASCDDSQATPLLLLTKDALAFEEYLRSGEKRGKKKVLIDVYAIYRELPSSSPSHAALHCVFNAYTKTSIPFAKMMTGVELLWDDWHRFHGGPSRRAYQKHLGFHAAQGNKERVYSLWTEYIEHFRGDPTVNIFDDGEGSDTFAHLLQVHAVNAEPEEAQRIFDDMTNKFKLQPSIFNWNILLNAYVKADDYDGAIRTFDSLCEATSPDRYSYGTLMQMAGSRGDLGFAVDLYRRARNSGVLANDAMLSSLIDAYCQNDLFKEAEDVCTRAASKGMITTRMWNKLLYYNALRRDLGSINKILNTMADKNIPYNQFTYQQLLLGLGLCQQSQHALHLLTIALKENVFEVTPTHFQIVMGALLRTGEPVLIRRLCILMNENKIPITEDVIFRLIQAFGQWRELPPRQREQRSKREWLGDALRTFYEIYGYRAGTNARPKGSWTPRPMAPRGVLRSGREVYQFSTMMSLFAQLNDSVQVRELVELYRYVFQGTPNDDGILPLSMLNAVLLSSLQDQRHDRVQSTWQLLFENAKLEARSADFNDNLPHTNKISPKYRFALSGGLRVMQEMLFKEGNASGLRELIQEVRNEGFEVDSKNWNYHIQVLVQMKQYSTAFAVCERVLMPNWSGWYTVRAKEAMRNALPLDTRRKGSSPRYLRPTATTLYRLAQAYLELNRRAPWSSDAATTLHEIERSYTQVIRAIKSMVRLHSDLEEEVFGSLQSADIMDSDELDEDEVSSDTRVEQNDQLALEGKTLPT